MISNQTWFVHATLDRLHQCFFPPEILTKNQSSFVGLAPRWINHWSIFLCTLDAINATPLCRLHATAQMKSVYNGKRCCWQPDLSGRGQKSNQFKLWMCVDTSSSYGIFNQSVRVGWSNLKSLVQHLNNLRSKRWFAGRCLTEGSPKMLKWWLGKVLGSAQRPDMSDRQGSGQPTLRQLASWKVRGDVQRSNRRCCFQLQDFKLLLTLLHYFSDCLLSGDAFSQK